jgi:hypothetical protein
MSVASNAASDRIVSGSNSVVVGSGGTTVTGPLIWDSTLTTTTNVAVQPAGDPNTGLGQIGGADTVSLIAGGAELRWSSTGLLRCSNVSAPEIDLSSNNNNGTADVLLTTNGATARGVLSVYGSGSAANQFGMSLASSVALLSISSTAPLVIGTIVNADVIFGANNVEAFRIDKTVKRIKFAAAGITANGSGVVTAPGSIGPAAIAVQEWATVQNAGGTLRYIPLYG